MKTKRPNETWTEYSRRLELEDIDQMKPQHIEIIKIIRDSEISPDFEEYGRIVLQRIIFKILLFVFVCLVIYGLIKYLVR